ncbi:hypothetical protein DFA_05841 [Cavenderia fasciculata]|uniref:RRM domain-containing protein n=1 Tax=Cavenderia fasciculata TaxID=261658 RepID=F4PMW3_CACFS|nr:uncharacterized protein DFA_05841 [Cavenderia fasciculata]EGG23707.1 hypothetical protein DFA_05841 [Cavenderia fasciculata]|eukprot:XP_004361558.1 hypothetical protein DFA_05841 [Cavenderia fasciculata]
MDMKKREFAEPEDSGFSATYDPLNGDSFHKRMKLEREGGGGELSLIERFLTLVSISISISIFDDMIHHSEEHIGPSAVVHCRGLPQTTTEGEITTLLSSYGRVESGMHTYL